MLFIVPTLLFILFFVVLNANDRGALFGTYEEIDIEGLKRQYRIHLPSGYDPSQSYPIVYAFHGYTDRDKFLELYSGFSNLADQEGFIVIYPKGLHRSWNSLFCCGYSWTHKVDDVGFIAKLHEEAQSSYSIDTKRVFATGFSNGGMFVQRLALELPGTFRAIAPFAATYGKAEKQLELEQVNTSIFLLNGADDNTIPLTDDTYSKSDFAFLSVHATREAWADTQNCQTENYDTTEQSIACKNGQILAWQTAPDTGHHLPDWRVRNPFNRTPQGTTDIWSFFKQF